MSFPPVILVLLPIAIAQAAFSITVGLSATPIAIDSLLFEPLICVPYPKANDCLDSDFVLTPIAIAFSPVAPLLA